jgi:transcriptional regulator of met regulon
MGIEIVSVMAGFSFGYCIMDIIQNYRTKRQVNELLKSTVEGEQE